jgi:hypothetical protein
MGMEFGFPCQGFIPRAKGIWNFHFLTSSKEPIPKLKIIFGERDEKTFCFFNAVRGNLFEDLILSDAFFGSFRIGYGIPSAAMKEPMIPTRGAGGKIALFNQNRRDPP